MVRDTKTGEAREAEGAAGNITLRGSTETVVEFFSFAINSILYQRGVYAPEHFASVQKYGLPIMVANKPDLQQYIAEVMKALNGWMLRSEVKKLVVVIASQNTNETLERWTFDIQVSNEVVAAAPAAAAVDIAIPRSQTELRTEQREIQAIIRQITASVTFLPLLEEPCTFDVLIYTDKASEEPEGWDESSEKNIEGGKMEVKLRSFNTKIHTVDGAVVYRFEGCSSTAADGGA